MYKKGLNALIYIKQSYGGMILHPSLFLAVLLVLIVVSSCNNRSDGNAGSSSSHPDSLKLFKQLDSSVTGIDFRNDIKEDEYTNAIVYEYTYNGGGVAIGDVNNDGLDDIFFTAN